MFLSIRLVPAPVFATRASQTFPPPSFAGRRTRLSGDCRPETSGNSYPNQGFLKCRIVQDVVKRAVETPLGACIGPAARYLGWHLGHDGLRGLRELREATVCLFELPANFAPPRKAAYVLICRLTLSDLAFITPRVLELTYTSHAAYPRRFGRSLSRMLNREIQNRLIVLPLASWYSVNSRHLSVEQGPRAIVIIGFDDVEKAKAWNESAAQKEVNDIRLKNTKSRSFIVATEGM
jgi:Domain of unknown function (DUF1330)